MQDVYYVLLLDAGDNFEVLETSRAMHAQKNEHSEIREHHCLHAHNEFKHYENLYKMLEILSICRSL